MKQKFDIEGMTCSACSAHLEKAVGRLDGVKTCQVSLLTNTMSVTYSKIKAEDIIAAVDDAGYKATLHGEKTPAAVKMAEERFTPLKTRLIVSIVFLIPLLYVAMGHMIKLPLPSFLSGMENSVVFILAQFFLTLPILYVNRKFFYVGFKRLFKGSPNMDTLIALGSSSAFIYGVIVLFVVSYAYGHGDMATVSRYHTDLYFESAGTILALITLGKYLEENAKKKTTDALTKLMKLTSLSATIEREGEEVTVKFEEINVDDILIIKQGDTLPVDGKVIIGGGMLDMSAINGESVPVYKTESDSVLSGSINTDGFFKYKATKVGSDTTVNKIVALVEEANMTKAPISHLADKISSVFVPIVMSIALIAFVIWSIIAKDIGYALSIAVSVLVISCPCALGLATPLAIMVGTGLGAKRGILIKNAECLETLSAVDTVIFDKTGTLTEGKPKVIDMAVFRPNEDVLDVALSIEKLSSHPLASAIIDYSASNGAKAYEVDGFVSTVGKGLKGTVNGLEYHIGSEKYINSLGVNVDVLKDIKSKHQGDIITVLADKNEVLAAFVLADTVKADSKEGVEELHKDGIKTLLLTGDNKTVAENIRAQLNIDEALAEVLPEGKQEAVKELQAVGRKVAMVGDGINDSVALSQANVGIAMVSGTDIAMESADIVLMHSRIGDVHKAVKLSKQVVRGIKQNLMWAFIYNAIGIPVAAGVLIPLGITMNPMIASLAMSLSSLFVVLNTLRMRAFNR